MSTSRLQALVQNWMFLPSGLFTALLLSKSISSPEAKVLLFCRNGRKSVLAWELNPGTPEERSFARQGWCYGNSSLWSKRSQGFGLCPFDVPSHLPHEGALGPGGCF